MQRRVREDLRRILAGAPGGDGGALLLSPRGDLAEHLAAGAAPGRETLSGDVANYCETPRLRRRIFDYKDAPDWLNSRFWANPQMWDKARW